MTPDSCLQDFILTSNTISVIWAYHEDDPISADGIHYHGTETRGTVSLILDGLTEFKVEMTPDMKIWEFGATNYVMPNGLDTTYFCQAFKAPEETLTRKHHVTAVGYRYFGSLLRKD